MKEWARFARCAAPLGCALLLAAASSNAQVTAQLSYCRPIFTAGTPTCGKGTTLLGPGYSGPGYANTVAERTVEVGLSLWVSPAADVKVAIAATERIEVCIATGSSGFCPGGAYVFYDKAGGVGSLVPTDVVKGLAAAFPNKKISLPDDWNAAAAPFFGYYVKVTPEKVTPYLDALAGGSCWNWSELASDPADDRFRVWGVNPSVKAFGLIDTCTAGAKVKWVNGPGPVAPNSNVCLPPDQAEYIRKIMISEDEAQSDRIQVGVVPASNRVQAWVNGQSGGKFRPFRVFIGPHTAGGQADWGSYRANIGAVAQADPTKPPTAAIKGDVQLLTHEYFHSLQGAWGREFCDSDKHINGDLISEGLAASIELNLCLASYPSAAAGDVCVSAGKLGHSSGPRGIYNQHLFKNPNLNLLEQSYASAVFWRYVQEQFSYPLIPANNAHSGLIDSAFKRADTADALTLSQRPTSDEGVDLVGRLFQEFAKSQNAQKSTLDILSPFLKAHIGRSLEALVLDTHTAMILKDYQDSDPRWRFDWLHQKGYNATTKLADGKPFDVPPDLYGPTCGSWSGSQICDGQLRAKRVNDSWIYNPPSNKAVPNWLQPPPSPGVGSSKPAQIGAYGAAYLSVSPDPAWAGQTLGVNVDMVSGPEPNFRIFRVESDAAGKLQAPSPICGQAPTFTCNAIKKNKFGKAVVKAVPITPQTRELILIASGKGSPSSFHWSFGKVEPTTVIWEPTSSLRAHIGSTAVRRSFLTKVTYRDVADPSKPLLVNKSDIRIRIPGCVKPAPAPPAKPRELTHADFGYLGLSAGNIFLATTVPTDFYPTGTGTLGLEVDIKGAVAAENDALLFGEVQPEALILAFDKGPSMGAPTTKLDALKLVAGALVQSLGPPPVAVPTNFAGIVAFDEDADTLVPMVDVQLGHLQQLLGPISTLSSGGVGTSIGDGLLESQFILAKYFDHAGFLPHRQSIILFSDGLSDSAEKPSRYYASKTNPEGDGNSSWLGQEITRFRRDALDLELPVVSAVAIGQDADTSELELITNLMGGTLTYIPGPEASTQLLSATLDFADAMTAAHDASASFDRIVAARTRGGAEAPTVIQVEPGATELRVQVVTAVPEGATGALRTPSGALVQPTGDDPTGHSAVYRVRDPEPGAWSLATLGIGDLTEPAVFVGASVLSRVQLFATANVEEAVPFPDDPDLFGPDHLTAQAGREVMLRAAPWELGPMLDCQVRAEVSTPSGRRRTVTLVDDGLHSDQTAGDGVFEALYADTSEPGLYSVRLKVSCVSPISGAPVKRERFQSFVLHPGLDADADGLPDAWEAFFGLSDSPLGDADADGLSDASEFAAGTDPRSSDSDGGGEADGSELAAGRDPRDPLDDLASAPVLIAQPGNGRVYLPLARSTGGVTVVVQRAPSDSGPFETLSGLLIGESFALDASAPNDQQVCYRVRVEADTVSGWSTVSCVTPRIDPLPPRVFPVNAPSTAHSRDVDVELSFEDLNTPPGGPGLPVSLDIPVGVAADMRVWFGAGPPDGVAWQPVQSHLALRLPDQDVTLVQVQARDLAGNLSQPLGLIITRPLVTPVDRAIALEEQAEDRIDANDLIGAQAAILASLDFVKAAMSRAAKAVKSEPHPDRVHVLTTLTQILALKQIARALLKPQTEAAGVDALRQALELEIALAAFADSRGIEL